MDDSLLARGMVWFAVILILWVGFLFSRFRFFGRIQQGNGKRWVVVVFLVVGIGRCIVVVVGGIKQAIRLAVVVVLVIVLVT